MERHLDAPMSLGDLPEEARTQRLHLDTAVAAQEDVQQMVEQLELQQSDAEETIPSGDELASEIERYLRGQGGGTRSGDSGL